MNSLKMYWRQLQKVGQKEKIIIICLLLFSFMFGFGGAVVIGLYPLTKNITRSSSIPTPTLYPASVMLTTLTKTVTRGNPIDVSINLSTPDLGTEAGDFILYFDPKFLRVDHITTGDFYSQYPVNKVENNFVKISGIASYINNKITIPKGNGTIATITFVPLAPTPRTLLYFDPDKTIVASNGQNTIGAMSSLTLTIQ